MTILYDKVALDLYMAAVIAEKLHLSVDARKDKIFHCDACGDTHEACKHWFPAKEISDNDR